MAVRSESGPTNKATIILPHDLYLACRILALERHTTLKDIATEALRDWLRKQENAEDLAAIAEAEAEGGEDIPWEQVKAELRELDAAERG